MIVVKEEIQELLRDVRLLQPDDIGMRDRAEYSDFVI